MVVQVFTDFSVIIDESNSFLRLPLQVYNVFDVNIRNNESMGHVDAVEILLILCVARRVCFPRSNSGETALSILTLSTVVMLCFLFSVCANSAMFCKKDPKDKFAGIRFIFDLFDTDGSGEIERVRHATHYTLLAPAGCTAWPCVHLVNFTTRNC